MVKDGIHGGEGEMAGEGEQLVGAPQRKRFGDVLHPGFVLLEFLDEGVGVADQVLQGPTLFHLNIIQ